MIAVHGAVADYRFYEPQLERLSRRRRVIVPSLAGYHPSQAELADLGADVHVEELGALLASLDEPGHVIGHSRGGRIALHVAARFPHLVRSLVLMDPGGVTSADFLPTEAPAAVHPPADALAHPGPAEAVEAYVDAIFGVGAWQATPDFFRRLSAENAHTMTASGTDKSLPLSFETCRLVQAPTLLVDGTKSPLRFGLICDALQRGIRNARRYRASGSDHFMPINEADRFSDLVERFLDEVESYR